MVKRGNEEVKKPRIEIYIFDVFGHYHICHMRRVSQPGLFARYLVLVKRGVMIQNSLKLS